MTLEHYLNRLISQHRGKPKFEAWITALVEQGVIDEEHVDNAFNILWAVGTQLDILGGILGRERLLPFEVTGNSALMEDGIYRIVLMAKIAINQWDGTMDGLINIWQSVFLDVDIDVTDNQDMTMKASIYDMPAWFPAEIIAHHYVIPKPEGVGMKYEMIMRSYQTQYFAAAHTYAEHQVSTVGGLEGMRQYVAIASLQYQYQQHTIGGI